MAGVTSSQVGSYFVGQYYQVLQTTPEYAHQFYTETSTMIVVDGDNSETASTVLQIYSLLTSLNFTTIEIKTINSLESWNGGIMVMVSGSVKLKDLNGKRKFVQSFFLAPQEKGYFVLNDIFQFIEEETISQPPAIMQSENNFENQVNTSSYMPDTEQPVSDYVYVEEANNYMNSVHIDDDTVDKYSLPDQQQLPEHETETVVEETPLEESSASLQTAVNTVQEAWPSAVEEPVREPEKKTYASILRVAKAQAAPAVAAQPTYKQSSPPASEWQYTPDTSTQQSYITASYVYEAAPEATEDSFALEEEGEFKSVYVRNLPLDVTAEEMEEEFKHFGTIMPDGVFIRSRKDIGVCYAFVEYEEIHGVRNAIKASPIQLAGRQVFIEERRANSNAASRGGRGGRGRGRGSFQTDAPRGRFAGRGSGRGSSQNGGDYSRPRGNGLYQQRGSRQGS